MERLDMARLARVLAVGIPHHVTQRGNARTYVLDSDTDRDVYRALLQEQCELYGVRLLGYCLMSNHVHLVAVPKEADSLAQAMKYTNGRFALYRNTVQRTSGHVWQGRFYSCPLDEAHLWEALRYVELNPVRAALTGQADLWPWSSAGAHCGVVGQDPLVDLRRWQDRWNPATWQEYLAIGETDSSLATIRRSTHSGRPLGSADFVQDLEKSMRRRLTPQKGGRPSKSKPDTKQETLAF
jgi:putative transposase